jgi:acetyltransferase
MMYEIHHYPAELIDVVHPAGGGRVVLRPVLPQDRELLDAFFHNLSSDARCNRFMHPLNDPPSRLLREFTEVDYTNHVALIAETFVDGREIVIGEARYVRDADNHLSAEFAISLADAWQGKGLARFMLARLERRAASAGVRRLSGEALATNKRMLSLAARAGYSISTSLGMPGAMRLEKKLITPSGRESDEPTATDKHQGQAQDSQTIRSSC